MRRSSPAWTKRLARCVHHATSRSGESASSMRGSRPSQSDTAILPSDSGRARASVARPRRGRRPRAIRCTVSGGKPRRRCACSSRRNSRSCGAKSTTRSRPDGRSTRAASRDRARAVVEEVQHLVDDDDVERILRQREIVDVALPHAAMAQARAVEPRARERQHVERHVEAEAALDLRARTVRACARCRCRDRAASGTAGRRAPRGSPASTASSATCSLRMRSHSAAWRAKYFCAAAARAARTDGKPLAVARNGRVVEDRAAQQARAPARRCRRARPGGRRPRSLRGSARPDRASASSRRWREMRGCDWRRMSVRSETVSSASASSATMRSRVSSPAALRAPLRSANGSWAAEAR